MFWHFLYENLLLYKVYQEQVFGKKLPKIQILHTHTPTQILENLQYYIDCFISIIGEIPYFFEKNILDVYAINEDFFVHEANKNKITLLYAYINDIQFLKTSSENFLEYIENLVKSKPIFLNTITDSYTKNTLEYPFLSFIFSYTITEKNTKILEIDTENPDIFSIIYQQKKQIDQAVHFQVLQNIYTIKDKIEEFRINYLIFSLQNFRNISYPKIIINDFLAIDLQKKYNFLEGKNEIESIFLENFGLIFCDFSKKNIDFLQKNLENYFIKIDNLLANKGILICVFEDFLHIKKDILLAYFKNKIQILSIIIYQNKTFFILKKNINFSENYHIKLLKIKNKFNVIIEKYQNLDFFHQKIFLKNTSHQDDNYTLTHISLSVFLKNIQNIEILFTKSDIYFEILYKNPSLFKPLKYFFEVKNNTNFQKIQEKKAFFIFENITHKIEKIKNFEDKNDFLHKNILLLAINNINNVHKIPENVSLLKDKNDNIWLLENDFLMDFMEDEYDIQQKIRQNIEKNVAYNHHKQIFVCDIPLDIIEKNYHFAFVFLNILKKIEVNYLDLNINHIQKTAFFAPILPTEKPFFYEKKATEILIFSDKFIQLYSKNNDYFEKNNTKNPFLDNIFFKNYLNSTIYSLFFYEILENFLSDNDISLPHFKDSSKNKIIYLLQKTYQESCILDILILNRSFDEIPENTPKEYNKDKIILRKIGFEDEKEIDKICKNLYKIVEEKKDFLETYPLLLEKKHQNFVFLDKNVLKESKENTQLQAYFLENICKNLEILPTPTIEFLQKLNALFILLDIQEKSHIQTIINIFWKNVFSENFNLKKIEQRNQQKLF